MRWLLSRASMGKHFTRKMLKHCNEMKKNQLAKAIRQEMTLASHLLQNKANPKEVQWDEMTSPFVSSRCRVLCKSPTGPELDAVDIHAAKKARTD